MKNRKSAFIAASSAVRRAFLCGQDAVTGQNFDHRKAWIQQRLEFLAGQFGIEVLSFSVMSNHCHVVLRNRPDAVQDWSDEEVARRWWFLFPARKGAARQPEEPTAADLQMLAGSDWQRFLEPFMVGGSAGDALRRGSLVAVHGTEVVPGFNPSFPGSAQEGGHAKSLTKQRHPTPSGPADCRRRGAGVKRAHRPCRQQGHVLKADSP